MGGLQINYASSHALTNPDHDDLGALAARRFS
jgi:hypothetical protein